MRPSRILIAVLSAAVISGHVQGPTDLRKPSGSVSPKSASEVARQFVRLESKLLPEEWDQLAEFFLERPKPRWDKAHIVDVIEVGTQTKGDSGHVTVSTNSLGDLDSALHLSDYPPLRLPLVKPSMSACYGDDYFEFDLLLSSKHAGTTQRDGAGKGESTAWRVKDTAFEPLIALQTAMRYVRRKGEKTSDPAVRKNATTTLSILEYFQQRKPLPDELSAGATGGCG